MYNIFNFYRFDINIYKSSSCLNQKNGKMYVQCIFIDVGGFILDKIRYLIEQKLF